MQREDIDGGASILVPSVLKDVPTMAPVTLECTGWCRFCLRVKKTDKWTNVCIYELLDLTYSLQEPDPVESYVGDICVWIFIASHAELFFNKPFIFPGHFQCNQCLVAELTNPFSYSWTLGYRSFPSEGLERWLS